ncbi:unnamed protein product [Adineta ricciae]|uniref:Uncharacterized protein n=1 Tax=Adineta ricciae TaxID=249248 RepID=A0A814VW71_ADIRI|nr:unnamed protein product [Adineta ricciae]CAF1662112.1 unnamed protein product [Adineta ricciae]
MKNSSHSMSLSINFAQVTLSPIVGYEQSILFQALATFCRLSKSNVEQSISSFYSNTLVTPKVLSENAFQSQTQALIDQFRSRTPNTFNSQLRIVNQMTNGNKIFSALQMNTYYYYNITENDVEIWLTSIPYFQIDGLPCACDVTTCQIISSGIYDAFDKATAEDIGEQCLYIPRISAGCFPVDSILVSTLECFYNETCLNRLITFFRTNETFRVLNSTLNTPNTTVQTMIDNLMIEDWISKVSYEKYYSKCSPSLCTFFVISRRTFLDVLIKLISLLATLLLALRLIFSFLIRLIRRSPNATP